VNFKVYKEVREVAMQLSWIEEMLQYRLQSMVAMVEAMC
jgi:hypothetical protein